MNLYTYVSNNPMRFTDPSGNKQIDIVAYEEGPSIQEKFVLWYYFGDDSIIANATPQEFQQLKTKAYQKAWDDALSYFIAGVGTGLAVAFPTATFAALDVATMGVTTGTVVGGASTAASVTITLGKLAYQGNKVWKTSAGLIYGADKKYGNRVLHVLEHTKLNSNKANHTVFNVDATKTLALVDEAWLMKGSPLANDQGAYIVPMGRVVGTNGETSIRIIVKPGTSEIITAYPVS